MVLVNVIDKNDTKTILYYIYTYIILCACDFPSGVYLSVRNNNNSIFLKATKQGTITHMKHIKFYFI